MPQTSGSINLSVYGRTYSEGLSRTTDNGHEFAPTRAASPAGTLTTRTDNDTGTITAASGSHGIATADKLDVFWSGGHRRNMTVGTVAGTAIPIDGGAGDNLPAADTALTFAKVTHEGAWAVDGDDIVTITCQAPTYATLFVFRDSSDVELAAIYLPAGESYVWDVSLGVTNPLAGTVVAKVSISHAGTAAQVCPGAILYN